MTKERSPLLGGPIQPVSRRMQFAVSAVLLGCAAVLVSSIALSRNRASAITAMQQAPYMPQIGAQPVFYVPVAAQQQGLAAAQAAQPMVYYYAPAPAGMQIYLGQSLNATANSTGNGTAGGDSKKEDGEFSCTVANLIAESAKVQAEWDKCKLNPRYDEPNKKAGKRRLLEWVWEPDHPGQSSMAPQLSLRQYMLAANGTANGTNGTTDEGGGEGEMDVNDFRHMSECMQDAIGDSCENIDDCDDSVCKHYYNEPEIEALCGMCKIASKNNWGPFGSWRSVELWLVLLLFLTVVIAVPIIICECCWRRRRGNKGQ